MKELRKLPKTVIFSIQQSTICGTLDLILSVSGVFVALEIKSEGGRRSELQKFNIERILKSGGFAYFVEPKNWLDIIPILEKISKRKPINKEKL